jgi:hypothetical protein
MMQVLLHSGISQDGSPAVLLLSPQMLTVEVLLLAEVSQDVPPAAFPLLSPRLPIVEVLLLHALVVQQNPQLAGSPRP